MTPTPAAQRADETSRRVERVYGVLARVYDAFFDWALGPGRRYAVQRLDARPGERVLEVGVGTGLSLPLYPEHAQVIGIDLVDAMLDRARSRLEGLGRAGVELRQMDARDLQFPDGFFHRVMAPYVISVVPEPERVMQEMRRVCRIGGTVMVVNHFGSRSRVLRLLERAMTPLSWWIGFRLDLPIEAVTSTPGLEVVRIERVNLFGLWRLIEMRRVG